MGDKDFLEDYKELDELEDGREGDDMQDKTGSDADQGPTVTVALDLHDDEIELKSPPSPFKGETELKMELEPDETRLYEMGYMQSMLVKPSEVDEQSAVQDASVDMTEDLSVSGSNLAGDVESCLDDSILSDLPLSTYDDVQMRSTKRHRAVAPSDDTSDAESPADAKVSWEFLSLSSK